MLKLKLQYFGYLMRRVDSLEKTLMPGGIGGRRRRVRQRMRWLDGITDSMDMSMSELQVGDGQGGLECWDSWGCKQSHMTERLNWTELKGSYHVLSLLINLMELNALFPMLCFHFMFQLAGTSCVWYCFLFKWEEHISYCLDWDLTHSEKPNKYLLNV